MSNRNLTAERLRQIHHFDPETGQWTRLLRNSAFTKLGPFTPCPDDRGYGKLNIDRHQYYAHRLAWLYVYGEWPKNYIDHINGNKADNRISNLRDASPSINNQNKKRGRSDSKTGVLGVSPMVDGRFTAHIQLGKWQKNLGSYGTVEEAESVYLEAKRRLHEGCTI